ncbi:hypothetical protein GCM10028805_58850 [Spirosoma harenae]
MPIFTKRIFYSFLLFFIACEVTPLTSLAQTISGTVFRDFNANGTQQTYEPPIAGVEIRVFNASGANVTPGTVGTSQANGSYSITPTTGAGNYRIEFTVPTSLNFLYESFHQVAGAGTAIQFVSTGTSGINFALSARTDYCQDAPPLTTSYYVSGDPLAMGSSIANEHTMVSLPFSATGATPSVSPLADAYQIGSIWGLAFQRETNKLFSAAFLKRHTGLGPAGLGGIYVTTTSGTPSTSTYVDLEEAPFSLTLGASVVGTRTLPSSGTVSSNDDTAFDAVGKVGLGGLALSSDGATLYAVDLFNRQLLALAVGNPVKATLTASDLTKISIPDPGCTNGVARPFAVHVHDGKVYVGVICTGETSGTNADLFAHIYIMPEQGTMLSTSPTFSFRLNYSKGKIHTNDAVLGSAWETWTTTFSGLHLGAQITAGTRIARPQPILSDLDFADNGDMILGFMDRGGHQLGYKQRNPTQPSVPPYFNGYIGGDLLRAHFDGTNWVLENNGVVGSLVTASDSTGQGPGQPIAGGYTSGKEFFYEENYAEASDIHQETAMGSIAIVPGHNQTIATVIDPISIWAGGFTRFNNTTGAGPTEERVQLYSTIATGTGPAEGGNPATFGKTNGLGDIEPLCSPAPIEIGNRVWFDKNDDGIQGPDEPGLAGLRVTLSGTGLSSPVSVTTDAYGEYYFTNNTGTTTTGYAYSLSLTSGGSYTISFPTSFSTYNVSTKPNSASGSNADNIDTDANGTGLISFTMGGSGENNYSFDVGYTSIEPVCNLVTTAIPGPCVNEVYSTTIVVQMTNPPNGILNVADNQFRSTYAVDEATGTVSRIVVFNNLPANGAIHAVGAVINGSTRTCTTQGTSYTAPTSCLPRVAVTANPGACSPATNTYSVTGSISLTNASAGTVTVYLDNVRSATIAVSAGATSVPYSLTGLLSGTGNHTIAAEFGSVDNTATYSAPASCSVTPVCSISAVVNPGSCQAATNTFSNTVVVTVYNPTAGSITIRDGNQSAIFSTTANIPNSFTAVFPGFIANGANRSVITTLPGCSTTTTAYSAPNSCSVSPICSLTATVSPGICHSATNAYDAIVVINLTNASSGTLSVSISGVAPIRQRITAGTTSLTVIVPNLMSDGATHIATVSLPGCSTTTATYNAPESCTQPTGNQLIITKVVDKTRAKQGDILTYSLTLTNIGSTTATNVVVRDSASTGLTYLANSSLVPTGTTFNSGIPVSTWVVAQVSPGQSYTVSFQARVDSTGILYSRATIPGDTAVTSTSVPVIVCKGDTYLFRLSVPAGKTSYQWFKNGVAIPNATTNTLDVSTPGSYSLAADSLAGQCPSFSCSPFIIEEDTLPTFQAIAYPVSCLRATPQTNGQIVLTNFRTGYTYQYSAGINFNESAVLSGVAKSIPVNGIIANNLTNPSSVQAYTIRVYNSSGCYTDVTVTLNPTVCTCPAEVCVPLVIKQTKGTKPKR